MDCPTDEVLLRHGDGEAVPDAVTTHVAACPTCQAKLLELAGLDAQVAAAAPVPADERAALRLATERVLRLGAAADGRRPTVGAASLPPVPRWAAPWRWARVLVLAAACVVALWATWAVGPPPNCVIERYRPAGELRADPVERYSLQVSLRGPRWVAIWQQGADGLVRLLPHANPVLGDLGLALPLGEGWHRVPATELLDFEFPAASPPQQVVVVPSLVAFGAAELAAIEALLRAGGERANDELRSRYPETSAAAFRPR